MKKRRSLLPVPLLALILFITITSLALAATFVTNTTPGDVPAGSGATGWTFTAQSDTSFGESVCIEVHPQGDPANYVRSECAFAGGSAPNFDWTCTVFTGGVPAPFQSATVEYQFFVDADANNCSAGGLFTGFAWAFQTDAVGNPLPAAVTLAAFNAQPDQSQVTVRWETATEQDNLGFNLYRATTADGARDRLNGELIAAQQPGSGSGAQYEFVDSSVQSGNSYFYWLEDLSLQGQRTLHGPVSATLLSPTAVTLQSVGSAAEPHAAWPALLAGALLALGATLWRTHRR